MAKGWAFIVALVLLASAGTQAHRKLMQDSTIGTGADQAATTAQQGLQATGETVQSAVLDPFGFGNTTSSGEGQQVNTDDLKSAIAAFQLSGVSNLTNSTVLVPNDQAFEQLPIQINNFTDLFNETLLQNSSDILNLHVIPGILNLTDIAPGTNITLTSAQGTNITFSKAEGEDGEVTINVPAMNLTEPIMVEQANLPIGNSTNILHVINRVLLPFPATEATDDQGVMAPEDNGVLGRIGAAAGQVGQSISGATEQAGLTSAQG